jgi:hypothetical protein
MREKKSQNNSNVGESGTVNNTGTFKLCNVIITLNVTDFMLVKMLLHGYPVSKPRFITDPFEKWLIKISLLGCAAAQYVR